VKIFVSYSNQDRPLADALAVGLRQEGHTVFFDRDNLPEGEAYHARIRADIDGSDLFVFVVSPDSLRPGCYALTELGLARRRWPDPSGHVLPVLASAASDIPPYLGAVTYVAASGNLVSETLAAVSRLARSRRRAFAVRAGAAFAVAAGLAIAAALLYRPGAAACYLRATVVDANGRSGFVIDAASGAGSNSFLVDAANSADLHVAGISADDAAWTLVVRAATGEPLARRDLRGCPRAAVRLLLEDGIGVTLAPR